LRARLSGPSLCPHRRAARSRGVDAGTRPAQADCKRGMACRRHRRCMPACYRRHSRSDDPDGSHRPSRYCRTPRRASVPLLLGLARDRRRRRVLDLQPTVCAPGTVRRAQALRYDALTAKRAGVPVDDRALGLVMGIEPDARAPRSSRARTNSRAVSGGSRRSSPSNSRSSTKVRRRERRSSMAHSQ
jgi:hypothetical protein